jgi:hypothetical protein
MLCAIIGVFVVIASDTTQTYHVAIVGYLSCGLVLTSSSVNSTIYSSNGAKEATAAGHILLAMVNVRQPRVSSELNSANQFTRLYGFSISDQHLLPFLVLISTHSRYTRATKYHKGDEAPAMDTQADQIHPSPQTCLHRCIHPLNSAASRLRHQSQVSQVVR